VRLAGCITNMATQKLLIELTECPVCIEDYVDPRVLPCGHTLCFQCVEKCCDGRPTGDRVACPLCRTKFTIPSSGVGGLPKNFALDYILQLSSVKSKTRYCDQHNDEYLTICCFDCQMVICTKCLRSHSGHRCDGISDVVENFSKEMKTDIDNITGGADKCRHMLNGLEERRKSFHEQIEKCEREINEKADKLKRMIDVQRDRLLNELSEIQQKRMEEIERVREEIQARLASLETYKSQVNKLIEEGAACNIVRAANDVHESANKLMTFDIIERSLAELSHTDVTFTSSDYVIGDISRTLGGKLT